MIVVWRPRAERDLDGLIRYIAQYNVRAAIDLDLRIERIVALVEANPQLGHATSDRTIRMFGVTSNIKLLYRIRPRLKVIEIVRIIHARRNLPSLP